VVQAEGTAEELRTTTNPVVREFLDSAPSEVVV
jgi:ABC-type transporter Mla maintaining outer membrane lipid asymmetry ATPase subunit MlaF